MVEVKLLIGAQSSGVLGERAKPDSPGKRPASPTRTSKCEHQAQAEKQERGCTQQR